jgi:protein phosphatase PTC1
VLETVFLKIDKQLALLDSEHTGSTACVAVVRREINHNVLYVANVGDTRAVLSKNGQAQRLSVDHKATDPTEIERVKSLGGSIIDNRVAGGLAITRALGDHAFKTFGVTGQPYIVRHVLRPFDKYLIIATDGIWDTVSDEMAVAECKDDLNTKQIAQNLVKLALNKGSGDNIGCMVLKFNAGNIF